MSLSFLAQSDMLISALLLHQLQFRSCPVHKVLGVMVEHLLLQASVGTIWKIAILIRKIQMMQGMAKAKTRNLETVRVMTR